MLLITLFNRQVWGWVSDGLGRQVTEGMTSTGLVTSPCNSVFVLMWKFLDDEGPSMLTWPKSNTSVTLWFSPSKADRLELRVSRSSVMPWFRSGRRSSWTPSVLSLWAGPDIIRDSLPHHFSPLIFGMSLKLALWRLIISLLIKWYSIHSFLTH